MSMLFFVAAAVLSVGGFSAAPLDGGSRVILTTTRTAAEMKDVRCRWTVYKDAFPAASGNWYVEGLAAGSPVTNAAPPLLRSLMDRGGDFALRIRLVTGDEDSRKETLLALAQIDFPRAWVRPLSAYEGKPAVLTETAAEYEFRTPSHRIRFDRGTGLLSGFATGWWSLTEWLKRPMAFDFGDSAPKVRMEAFTTPSETNGVWSFRTVAWWKPDEKNFELRVATDWQVRGDGRVVSQTRIRPFGLRRVLPRVGWAFVLAPPNPLVQYYGCGSAADSKDAFYRSIDGLYSSSVAGCGSHDRTRAVAFDAGADHFALSTLGDNFFLEVGTTPSKTTFCGVVVARQAETDRDWQIDLLISPEKTLLAMAPPEEAKGSEGERRETGDASGDKRR